MLRQNSPDTGRIAPESARADSEPTASPTGGELDIQRELNRLEELILSSPHLPLTRRTLVDEEQILGQLDVVWTNLPDALDEAVTILQQQDEIIERARAYAQETVAAAERRAEQILDDTGIVQRAQHEGQAILEEVRQECEQLRQKTMAEAERLRQQARADCAALRRDADQYAEAVLAELERQLTEMVQVTRNGRESLVKSRSNPAGGQQQSLQQSAPAPRPNVQKKKSA